MGTAAERQPSENPGPEDEPADLTRICWTQWLRVQEDAPASARPPLVLSSAGERTEEEWR